MAPAVRCDPVETMKNAVIVRTGSVDESVGMKTSARRSPADRDRAVARLRTLTIGTGIAGIAAVGGFGAMAAVTYAGSSTTITTAAVDRRRDDRRRDDHTRNDHHGRDDEWIDDGPGHGRADGGVRDRPRRDRFVVTGS